MIVQFGLKTIMIFVSFDSNMFNMMMIQVKKEILSKFGLSISPGMCDLPPSLSL